MTPLPLRADYASLPDRFRAAQAPDPVTDPSIIRVNDGLAEALGLATAQLTPELLAGNSVTEGSTPIAMAYAGHQFGNFVPQLGDGRAVLLGEIVALDGTIFDVQLKGSGRTPFSRSGDGRAWLGPVLREYIVSEAMAALGIPTTRALAAVTTGETVYREAAMPGAILTRVAKSHIRVGTFQFFAARDDQEGIKTLLAFAIQRLYPDLAPDDAAGFLAAVAARQADLVAKWMGVGFIHGVMNTDNMALSGETIDYGPCAFMDVFHPETVFSSIDQMGRYAWRNQPGIAQWNLAQLATCLIPHLAGGDMDKGLEVAQTIIDRFPGQYQDAYLAVFREKLGLRGGKLEEDAALIEDFLRRLAEEKRDFTNSFRALADQPDWLGDWRPRWEAARTDDWQEQTRTANPAVIPRNHQIEAAIMAAVAGDVAPFHRLVDVLATPFALAPEHADLANPPAPEERVLQTFCGT